MMRRRKIQMLLLAITILFIWGNSLLSGDLSSAESNAVLQLVQQVLGGWVSGYLIRKAAHFTEFALLGVQLGFLAPDDHIGSFGRSIERGFLVAFIDETIQLFSQGRSGMIADVWLDSAGVCVGAGIALIIRHLTRGGAVHRIEK